MTGNINYTIIETIFCMQEEVELLHHRLENTIDTRNNDYRHQEGEIITSC